LEGNDRQQKSRWNENEIINYCSIMDYPGYGHWIGHWHRFGRDMRMFIIFDHSSIRPERFTIVNGETGDVFGASENPHALNWTARFIGNCADHRVVLRGAGWRQGLPSKKMLKTEIDNYVNNARLNPDWLGKEIEFTALPENIRRYIACLTVASPAGVPSEANVVYMAMGQEEKAPAFGG
jgi:hypothetical protein